MTDKRVDLRQTDDTKAAILESEAAEKTRKRLRLSAQKIEKISKTALIPDEDIIEVKEE